MRKFYAVLIILLIALSFAGCTDISGFARTENSGQPAPENEYVSAEPQIISSETVKLSEPEAGGVQADLQNGSGEKTASADSSGNAARGEREDEALPNITLSVNGADFSVNLEDNETAREFADMLKEGGLSIEMSDYGGFEKVGSLGRELTADNVNMTTQTGDIVLYNSSNIVMFYGSNTWDYTKIGSVKDADGFKDALGGGDVTALFSIWG